MSEVLRQQSIHPQNFQLSRQEFFEQPVFQLTNDGQRYSRAPLGARGNTTCSMAQSCQVSWQIIIPGNRLALQINQTALPANIDTEDNARTIVNFNDQADPQADWARTMQCGDGPTLQPINSDEHIKLWIGYSTACGPLQQIAICKDNTKLWETSIYAREQAVIAANSLSDLCTNNSVSASSLESIVRGRRHCGIFLDIPVSKIATIAGAFNYKIPEDITIAGVLDLNQLSPIFNSFPVLTRNYASLYLQLWTQDFFQDLKVVWFNKGSKAIKIYYPHKFMFVWKMATDDSFMRGYNASKMGARTNIQVSLTGSLTEGIVGTELIKFAEYENQNNLISFIATRAFPTPTYTQITPQMHYLCDAIIRFTFDDAPDPQVLNFEIIGEVGGTMIRSG
ncbi:MAG: hypothetical protein EZS28_000293 [Streblomastix strix]|uniref:Uncharacterized protein n=1 Tax=Streblomastix strix TaxID=222440 RepID=A0A5J4XAK7_9EUKA|nr:MAG: hypothetical protein EZS28_000293 [Streblomastix strix]